MISLFVITAIGFHPLACARKSTTPVTDSSVNAPRAILSASEIREVSEGKRIHDAILATHYLYDNQAVVRYVSEVGSHLVKYAKRPYLPYTFTVLVDERMYSTCAPGGYIYITTGLMSRLENEAELAGVLAHEIAEAQDPLPYFSSFHQRSEDLAGLVSMVGPFFGPVGALSAAGAILLTSAQPISGNKHVRLFQADRYALDMLLASGYDPQAFIDLLKRTQKEQETNARTTYDWLQSRPVTTERVDHAESLFSQMDLSDRSLSTGYRPFEAVVKSVREMYGHF